MLWSPYWARSFSPLLSNLAAASSTLVNQEQKRSADGWKLCNDAIPEFKSLPLEETPELRLSYLDSNTESHLTVIPNKIRKQRKKALFLGFFSAFWSSYKVHRWSLFTSCLYLRWEIWACSHHRRDTRIPVIASDHSSRRCAVCTGEYQYGSSAKKNKIETCNAILALRYLHFSFKERVKRD